MLEIPLGISAFNLISTKWQLQLSQVFQQIEEIRYHRVLFRLKASLISKHLKITWALRFTQSFVVHLHWRFHWQSLTTSIGKPDLLTWWMADQPAMFLCQFPERGYYNFGLVLAWHCARNWHSVTLLRAMRHKRSRPHCAFVHPR